MQQHLQEILQNRGGNTRY